MLQLFKDIIRTIILSVAAISCFSCIMFAQSSQPSSSNQNSQDPNVDSQRAIVDPTLTQEQITELPNIKAKPPTLHQEPRVRRARSQRRSRSQIMKTDLQKNVSDIFSGCGNGTLSIAISREIDPSGNNWDASRGDRWLDVCINDDDLEAISLAVYNLSFGKPYDGTENILKLRNDDRQWFAKTFPEFQMLGRINYMYEDAYFDAKEVYLLREECVKVKSATNDPAADLGLRKLIYSCDEAMRKGFCLELWCD